MLGEGIAIPSMPEPYANAHDPKMPSLLPCEEVLDNDDIGGAWSVLNGETVLLEDFKGFEEALLAETSDAEALEPQMLVEAKHQLD